MLETLQRFANRMGLTMTRCSVCGVVIDKTHTTLCAACIKAMQPRTGGYCPQCGLIFGQNDDPTTVCAQCRHKSPPWNALHFYGNYTGKLRELILSYKFNNSLGKTRFLANIAHQAFAKNSTRMPDIIIPVPLHTRRLLWRGFNQSIELARLLGKELNTPMLTDGLIRTRHTIPQTRLGLAERQSNIKDAFAAKPSKVQGLFVLVLDDVYTTGATLRECAKTLKRAGAAGVEVLVLARAQ
jgi:ComF family protein